MHVCIYIYIYIHVYFSVQPKRTGCHSPVSSCSMVLCWTSGAVVGFSQLTIMAYL